MLWMSFVALLVSACWKDDPLVGTETGNPILAKDSALLVGAVHGRELLPRLGDGAELYSVVVQSVEHDSLGRALVRDVATMNTHDSFHFVLPAPASYSLWAKGRDGEVWTALYELKGGEVVSVGDLMVAVPQKVIAQTSASYVSVVLGGLSYELVSGQPLWIPLGGASVILADAGGNWKSYLIYDSIDRYYLLDSLGGRADLFFLKTPDEFMSQADAIRDTTGWATMSFLDSLDTLTLFRDAGQLMLRFRSSLWNGGAATFGPLRWSDLGLLEGAGLVGPLASDSAYLRLSLGASVAASWQVQGESRQGPKFFYTTMVTGNAL